jgi:hypothetical protein
MECYHLAHMSTLKSILHLKVSFQRGVDSKVENFRNLEHAQVECLSCFGVTVLYRVPESCNIFQRFM